MTTLRLTSALVALAASVVFVTAGAGGVAAHEYTAKSVKVAHPWARATPPGAKVGAAYLEIAAAKQGADTLIGARAEVAGRVEIHTHKHEDGIMKMQQIERLPVAAGQSVVLKPSGDHIMLMDLKKPLVEGDLLPITLVFEKAGEITVEATVEPIGAKGPHGMDHQPGHEGGHGEHKH